MKKLFALICVISAMLGGISGNAGAYYIDWEEQQTGMVKCAGYAMVAASEYGGVSCLGGGWADFTVRSSYGTAMGTVEVRVSSDLNATATVNVEEATEMISSNFTLEGDWMVAVSPLPFQDFIDEMFNSDLAPLTPLGQGAWTGDQVATGHKEVVWELEVDQTYSLIQSIYADAMAEGFSVPPGPPVEALWKTWVEAQALTEIEILTLESVPIPEPATFLLLTIGLLGAAVFRKKYNRKSGNEVSM